MNLPASEQRAFILHERLDPDELSVDLSPVTKSKEP